MSNAQIKKARTQAIGLKKVYFSRVEALMKKTPLGILYPKIIVSLPIKDIADTYSSIGYFPTRAHLDGRFD